MKISFERINEKNREKALSLHVANNQLHFIESVEECLKEADEFDCWVPVGLCIDEKWVGFTMFCKWEDEKQRVWLDRFLIDFHYQGKGYARLFLNQLIPLLFDYYQSNEIYLSVYPNNPIAISLYQSYGFHFNGERDINDEWIMVLYKQDFKDYHELIDNNV